MNRNTIVISEFSNPATEEMYRDRWPGEPKLKDRAEEKGEQCGACSFFAPFTADYGLCCHHESRHHLETVFEHLTCPVYEAEGWGPHSFTTVKEHHCRCDGEGSEYWDNLLAATTRHERGEQAVDGRKQDQDLKSEIRDFKSRFRVLKCEIHDSRSEGVAGRSRRASFRMERNHE